MYLFRARSSEIEAIFGNCSQDHFEYARSCDGDRLNV